MVKINPLKSFLNPIFDNIKFKKISMYISQNITVEEIMLKILYLLIFSSVVFFINLFINKLFFRKLGDERNAPLLSSIIPTTIMFSMFLSDSEIFYSDNTGVAEIILSILIILYIIQVFYLTVLLERCGIPPRLINGGLSISFALSCPILNNLIMALWILASFRRNKLLFLNRSTKNPLDHPACFFCIKE